MSFNIYKPIRLIELFAGIGSQAKAMKNLGLNFEHWRVCEFDSHAIRSYNAVHDTNFTTSDITKINASDLNIVETDKYNYVLTYSFPCQDLSNAGKGRGMEKGSGTRSGLLWEVERLLNECKELPQVLLMENVPQVHGKKNIEHFEKWIAYLESKGYSNYWQDLNAKDYGMPQNRNRCYMVSILGEYSYRFPKTIPLTLKLGDMLEKEVDEKYYLSEKKLNTINKWNCLERPLEKVYGKNSIARTLTTRSGAECGSLATYCEQFEETTNIVPLIEPFDVKEMIKENNKNAKHQQDLLQHHEDICRCIPAGTHGSTPHLTKTVVSENPLRIRKLTPTECWRLMGFDDVDVEKAALICSNTQLYKQAGNSIVVNVLMAIFKELFIPTKNRSQWLDELLNN